jgi:hypothetical protein
MFYCIFINGLYHAGLTIGPSRTWLNRSCRAWLNRSEARHAHDPMRASCSCRTNFTVLQTGPFNPAQMASIPRSFNSDFVSSLPAHTSWALLPTPSPHFVSLWNRAEERWARSISAPPRHDSAVKSTGGRLVFAFELLFQSSRGHPLDHSSPEEHEEELGACFGPVVPLWEDGKKRLMHLSTISPLGKNIYYFMSSFDFFIHSPYLFIFIIYIYYFMFCFVLLLKK